MTQPARPLALLTRRAGPLPVWVWFLIFVLVVGMVIIWRRRKAGKAASNVYAAPNLTNQPSTLVPYTSDIFVNVQQPGATGPTGPTGPVGPSGPAGPQPTPIAPYQPSYSGPSRVSVGRGADLYAFADSVGLTFSQLEALNQPWFRSNINWQFNAAHPGYKDPLVITGRPYQVR